MISLLVWKIINLGRIRSVFSFLDQVSNSEDAQILGQAFFTRLRDYYTYLQKEKIRVTRATVEKNVRIYHELAGHFEKHLRVIIGLLENLRNDVTPNYDNVRKRILAINEQKVSKDKEFSDFVSAFNRTIRNAISHGSYMVDPLERKVEFINHKRKVSIRYQDFLEEVRELSALVLALSQIYLVTLLYEYRWFKLLLERNENT